MGWCVVFADCRWYGVSCVVGGCEVGWSVVLLSVAECCRVLPSVAEWCRVLTSDAEC